MSEYQRAHPHARDYPFRDYPFRDLLARHGYGVVLLLIVLTYLAYAFDTAWSHILLALFQGGTLLVTLLVAHVRPIWLILAGISLVAGLGAAIGSLFVPASHGVAGVSLGIGSLLLLLSPGLIIKDIARSRAMTTQAITGAICVYLLFGLCFALLYALSPYVSPSDFFAGISHPSANAYLFFSYSTLTTVGYGNLVPAGNVGQTLAMLEALLGQIYLVVIVARLVSLWTKQDGA